MTIFRFFLLVILFYSGTVLAIDEPRLIKQVDLLVTRLRKEHVKPPAIDDSYGKQVNALLMESLDPQKVVFTDLDRAEFERLSATIDQDIEQKKISYFNVVTKRFDERLTRLLTEMQTFFKQPVALNKKQQLVVGFDEVPTSALQLTKWKQLLQLDMLDNIMFQLGDRTSFAADSLTVVEKEARTAVGKRYTDLFVELRTDEVLETIYLETLALSFDPHTLYFSPSLKDEFEEELTPDRERYGFSFGENDGDRVVITDVYPGSPAWLSDELHEGDVVVNIEFDNGKSIDLSEGGKSVKEISRMFDEYDDRTVILTVSEDGMQRKVKLKKDKIYSDADVIKNAVLHADRKIGYVSLPDFYVNWTDTSALGCANDLAKCILKLKKENIEGLILDLRGNGGGSLREAVDMSGLFIDYGPIVAMSNAKGEVDVLKDFNRGALYTGPLIVLIDEGSASASEVVAGVLQDYNKALIVGNRSYGKATSQRIYALDPVINDFSQGFMKENPELGYANVTTGVLYRVTKGWNQKTGVTPDIELPFYPWSADAEREASYSNALTPDSISKKMVFTPAPALPAERLRKISSDRIEHNEVFTGYQHLMNEYEALITKDSIPNLDLDAELQLHNEWSAWKKRHAEYLDGLPLNFRPEANVFDNEIYKANPVLKEYHERFLSGLKEDIGLMEAVNILQDFIAQPK